MFSGPGISVFFQPLRAAGTETVPPQAIVPPRKVGDEQRGQESFHEAMASEPQPPRDVEGVSDDVEFSEDHTTLSIQAVRGLLGGVPNAAIEDNPQETPEGDAPPALRAATAAYLHAAAARPPDTPHATVGFIPPPRDQASGKDILLMLAQIEAAGIKEIAVRDGASIYDTLTALCWSLQR